MLIDYSQLYIRLHEQFNQLKRGLRENVQQKEFIYKTSVSLKLTLSRFSAATFYHFFASILYCINLRSVLFI